MKTIAGLLVLVMLVTVIAVSGSRAQPLSGSSVAFQQCLEQVSPPGDRCTSAVTMVAGVDEVDGERGMNQATNYGGDFGQGQDLSSPEFWTEIARAIFVYVAEKLVDLAFKHFFSGGGLSADLTAYTSPVIFDPVR